MVGLDLASMAHMRPSTQVDERTTPVHSGSRRGDLFINNTELEFIVLQIREREALIKVSATLTLNISLSWSLVISNLTNGCFSFTAVLNKVSRFSKSLGLACLQQIENSR